MDLNHLYCLQQRALMRASATADTLARDRHHAMAARVMARIVRFQRAAGAGIVLAGTPASQARR
jgi:DNA helicase TIP49 (TBP-interacting protein)